MTPALSTVSDGSLVLPVDFVLPDTSADAIAAILNQPNATTITPDCNVAVWRDGNRITLFDAGSGPLFMPTAGDLVANLEAEGIDPAAVTDVIFTHAHPDHIWGVLDDFDELTFPDARYHIAAAEWDFWRADDTMARLPQSQQAFVVGARNRFAAIEDRVALIAPGEEVIAGVEAVATPGHTPGHMSYVVHGAEPVLVIGDALSHARVSFEKPDWRWGPDLDSDVAIKTRLRLLDRIAADRLRIAGYHLPQPGLGTAERKGTAYRFVGA